MLKKSVIFLFSKKIKILKELLKITKILKKKLNIEKKNQNIEKKSKLKKNQKFGKKQKKTCYILGHPSDEPAISRATLVKPAIRWATLAMRAHEKHPTHTKKTPYPLNN